ncbi:deoxyribose-phosphate aldolase [Spirosoma utsteinense]|uniref:Deoxyribose-phosphate aldolase n=1 Tax=Spirosoma utsteinense TaxID=2585773 RepID=A0ABR6W594_9BACT|nr:deoxyribose-phosphate aldolase [Spirosoma utsteinense]MBC3785614.1 deoxyribose-phosphate aldolase [Spirosoma utsteinense]MBC3791765.1 deoxyribose-phosphate aldolase [Spirosoma utsteinense]
MDTTLIHSIARMIDHALLHPTLTDAELRAGCALALRYEVASVCVKPYAIPLAADLLAGSDVRVGTVIGFPHGSNATIIKVAETVQACRDGAVEIDMVVNVGKVLSEDWTYVEAEIRTIHETCRANGAILKVIFENDFLTNNQSKIGLCTICSAVGVEFVKTSTGFGFVKDADGTYNTVGATLADLQLMLDHVSPAVGVKASGGIRTLNDLLTVREMGVTRVGTSSTAAILDEAHRQFGEVPLSVALDEDRDVDGSRDVGY